MANLSGGIAGSSEVRYRSLLAAFLLVATAIEASAADLPIDPRLLANRVSITSGDGTEISGFLYRPQTADPRPAVLMLHGCSGLLTKKSGRLKSRETTWRDIFLAEGYVVLLLDSFTERGHRSICGTSLRERPIEPHRERPHDAYSALRWLQNQPFVDPGKVALGGWSNGAMSMLWTVDVAAPQRPAGLAHDFRAAFGFYPGCITLKKRRPDYTAAVPTLLQLGADDDWTWPKPCQELAKRATALGGASITVETYDGAAHSFDHPKSKRRTITVSDGRRVQIGTHTAARNAAIKRIRSYLAEAFEY